MRVPPPEGRPAARLAGRTDLPVPTRTDNVTDLFPHEAAPGAYAIAVMCGGNRPGVVPRPTRSYA